MNPTYRFVTDVIIVVVAIVASFFIQDWLELKTGSTTNLYLSHLLCGYILGVTSAKHKTDIANYQEEQAYLKRMWKRIFPDK